MSSPLSANLESILDRFDDAWNGPTPPRIEDYLTDVAADQRLPLLIELVRIDLERRLAAGEKARLDETYLRRFPELLAEPPAIVTLVKHEYGLRRRSEPELMPAEYVERFPQCQTELLAQLPTLDEIRDGEWQPRTVNVPAGLDLRGYELIETLGKGGMGEVYRCVDPALGRDLAIKVMMPAHRDHPECERRFLREARVTGSLQHPGIVPIYNLGRLSDGRLHYTMRLVRGRTFAAILKVEAGIPECLPYLLTIFEKICQAVAYAHSKRVIHRDLKPQNVMVDRFGEVQVMDWGLAKVLTAEDTSITSPERTETAGTRIVMESADTPVELSRTGSGMGTPAYMPPEQALGEWDAVDERADVFALGSILCQMLTGQPAYSGTDGKEVYRRAKRSDVAEASQRLQQCEADAALTALCRECLSPRREDRPRDANAVAKRVAEHQVEMQERLRRAEVERAEAQLRVRADRKQRRLLVALVLTLLAGGTLSTWLAVRSTLERNDKEIALGQAETAAEAELEAKKMAEARLEQNEKALKLLSGIFHDLNPRIERKGGPSLREQLIRRVEEAAAQLEGEKIGDPIAVARLQVTLGSTLRELGQTPQAVELLAKARTTLEARLGTEHPDALVGTNELAVAYYEAGQLDKALPMFEQVLITRKAKFGVDDPETFSVMNNLAEAYNAGGQLAKALPLYEQTLAMRKANLGADHPQTLISMNNLGVAYCAAGRMDTALSLLEQGLTKHEAKLGADHPDTLSALNNLAFAYQQAGRLDKALPLYEKGLARIKARLGVDHPTTLTLMSNLAEIYGDLGQLEKGRSLHEQALELRKVKLGNDHPDTLLSMNTLAVAYRASGQSDKAMPLFEQTLAKRKAKLGDDHPDTLTSMNNLAQAYHDAGKLDKAVPLYELTLEKRRAKLGADHPSTLTTMNNLAGAYKAAGDLDKAVPLYERTLAMRKKKLEPDHPNTLATMSNLAQAYQEAKQLAKALPLYEETLAKITAKLGAEHPDTLTIASNLAGAYKLAGHLDKALPLFEQTLAKQKAKLGADHPRTLVTMNNLAVTYRDAGRWDKALPLLEQTLELRQSKLGGDHPRTLTTMTALAKTYRAADQLDREEALLRELVKRWQKRAGPDSAAGADASAQLGLNLLAQKKYTEAESVMRSCLAIHERKWPDQWGAFHARSLLGEALLGRKQYSQAEPLLLQGYEGMEQRHDKIPTSVRQLRRNEALERLVRLYEATDQKNKAADWRKKLQETKSTQKKPKT